MTGTIKYLHTDRGFGFVTPDDDRDPRSRHFFHCSSLVDFTFDEKLLGQRVEFDSQLRNGKLAAVNVRPVR
jgi:cold shock CspA family protein